MKLYRRDGMAEPAFTFDRDLEECRYLDARRGQARVLEPGRLCARGEDFRCDDVPVPA